MGTTHEDKLPGHEYLKWTDSLRANVTSDKLQRDTRTGEVYSPQKKYLEERIRFRKDEAEQEARAAAAKSRKSEE